jgi:hypothetical protein
MKSKIRINDYSNLRSCNVRRVVFDTSLLGPRIDAVLIQGLGCSTEGCLALGPVSHDDITSDIEPWKKVRYGESRAEIAVKQTSWITSITVLLPNGDSLLKVQKCAQWDSSACVDWVCTKYCTGIAPRRQAAALTELQPNTITCRSEIPDVEDCPPSWMTP